MEVIRDFQPLDLKIFEPSFQAVACTIGKMPRRFMEWLQERRANQHPSFGPEDAIDFVRGGTWIPVMLKCIERYYSIKHVVCERQMMYVCNQVRVSEYSSLGLYDILKTLGRTSSAQVEDRSACSADERQRAFRKRVAKVRGVVDNGVAHTWKQERTAVHHRPAARS